jgi:hypothetical protein
MDPLPSPIAYSDGDFFDDRLFIAGGGAGYSPWPARADVYSWKDGDGWMTATPLPAPVGCPHVEVTSINDTIRLFVFGGYNEGYLNSMYVGRVTGGCFCRPGDANGDGVINVADAVYIINYVFKNGPPPTPYPVCSGDAQCDCSCNVADAVYLINYVFKNGPPPCNCEDWVTACGTP